MSDEWDFYSLLVDDQPASIFLDMGIAREAPISGHGTMGYLRVHMRQPREDGLSSEAEFQTLLALEDDVTPKITTAARAIFVGRNTSSGNRDFYFYVVDGATFEATATAAMAAFNDYTFDVGSRADPNWETYFEFLYPSLEQRQCIANRHVCESLAKHGDQGDQPRRIDHLAIFSSKLDCEAYADFVRGHGFAVAEGYPLSDGEGAWRLEFSRTGTPREIDRTTLDLFREAKDRGGDYDGWGCEMAI